MKAADLKRVSRMREHAASGKARQWRLSAGVGLREVAAAMQTSPSALSRWETGVCSPRPQFALRWAKLLTELTGEQL